jgi:hypothetical protein
VYARAKAMLCLLIVSTAGRAATSAPAWTSVDVYLKDSNNAPASVIAVMMQELDHQMERAGFRVVWRSARQAQPKAGSENLVVAELRGNCEAPSAPVAAPLSESLPLASSPVVDGRILPFPWVDCSTLNRFLGTALADDPEGVRNFLYGRAIGRLLAHEFYHILAHISVHMDAGVAKARFSTLDLLASHFELGPAALDALSGLQTTTDGDDSSAAAR